MNTQHEYLKRLNSALQFIENNYAENIQLNDIADAANFSPFHFHRVFTAMCEESPIAYLKRVRLEKAALLLRLHNDYTINRIMAETGFSSLSVFSRSFTKKFGIPASEYRKKPNINKISPAFRRSSITPLNSIDTEQWKLKEIRQLSTQKIAYVRSMNGYGPEISKAWHILFAWATVNNAINSTTQMFGIPLDDPEITKQTKCRYFAGITINNSVKSKDSVEIMVLAPGKYALFDFEGKSTDIPLFYKYLYGTWLPKSGYLPDDRPLLENYPMNRKIRIDPMDNRKIFCYTLLLPIRKF